MSAQSRETFHRKSLLVGLPHVHVRDSCSLTAALGARNLNYKMYSRQVDLLVLGFHLLSQVKHLLVCVLCTVMVRLQ